MCTPALSALPAREEALPPVPLDEGYFDLATFFHPQAPCLFASSRQTVLGEQESYSVPKFILILWGTSALFTAPLKPSCWITAHLSRAVHLSASQALTTCSLQKTLLALVACGEARAEEQAQGRRKATGNPMQEDVAHLPGCTPAMAASFPRGLSTTLGTREEHTAPPEMDQQHLPYFSVLCLHFDINCS